MISALVFYDVFPETADDTFGTIGLDVGAPYSGISGAQDPGLVQDSQQPITPFFIEDGSTYTEHNTPIGMRQYVLNSWGK